MDNLTPTQIILARLLCFLVPVGVLMLGPKDALLRRLWAGKTPRMWHLETIAVMICVSMVVLVFGNDPVEWVGFAALTLAHGRNSIMFRLSEEQEKSTPLDPHHVECGRWIPVYFFGSELCWAAYFLLHRSWAALAGVAIFVSYGQWRRWYGRKKRAELEKLVTRSTKGRVYVDGELSYAAAMDIWKECDWSDCNGAITVLQRSCHKCGRQQIRPKFRDSSPT
jgi:hypothetical protein